ncbi:AraC family transcriptional regulator, partial [Eggerthella lenta]|nr:AraC family transcriptional regulator [Eggerthella lenta]
MSDYIARLEKLRPNSVAQKARKYIEENYQNPDLRLDDVAGYVYINASYFSSVFSKEMGISFGDYLTKVRIEKAMD